MPVDRAFLDVQLESIKRVHNFIAVTLVAFRLVLLAMTAAFGALLLEILDETRHDLLLLHDDAGAATFIAGDHVGGVVGA